MKIALFVTCLGDQFTPRSSIAAVLLLEKLGHTVTFERAQTCCGQPMFNNGFTDEARALARRMLDLFAIAEVVVSVSGSCVAMVREHFVHLFPDGSDDERRARTLAARTFELVEFLAKHHPRFAQELHVSWKSDVTCHSACHMRMLGGDGTEKLLGQVEGLAITPLVRKEQCCGFGGTFGLAYPAISGEMARDKVECIRASAACVVVSNEPGCTMHLVSACRRAGVGVTFLSAAELIAVALGLLPPT